MSDVTITANAAPAQPPSPAPAAPQSPQRSEVPVNPNPVDTPKPLPQALPASEPTEKPADRPQSRREAIQKAFAKQRAENPPQPREAKRGDNNPPEDTPDERIDLKKRPADQPRDRGRFATKASSASDAQPGAVAGQQAGRPGQQAVPQPYVPPPGAPAHHHPIPRMSPRAAAEWDKVPETVKADAHRIYNEVGRAFQQYKTSHEAMAPLAPYAKMAKEQGTTLDKVLGNHVAIEEKLRSDPIGAFEVITHNLNLQTPDGQKLTFRDLAWHALNQTPEQQQLIQQRNEAQATRMQLEAMKREQAAIANEYRRMQYAAHFQTTRGAVDQYADQRPRFDELGDLIHREIQLGFDLDTAYRRAELLRPATAAQTRGTTPAQTRTPDRSISGAPSGAPNGANGVRRSGKPGTRKDAIAHAIRSVRGAL